MEGDPSIRVCVPGTGVLWDWHARPTPFPALVVGMLVWMQSAAAAAQCGIPPNGSYYVLLIQYQFNKATPISAVDDIRRDNFHFPP